MKYKCIGNPQCLKIFDSGERLRAHIASCDVAQKILRAQAEVEKLEHDINVEYPGIYGLHRNTFYPTAHHLDQTNRYNFVDKYKFGSKNPRTDNTTGRMRKMVDSKHDLMNSSQVKSSLINPG
jgi:hypothetical protein